MSALRRLQISLTWPWETHEYWKLFSELDNLGTQWYFNSSVHGSDLEAEVYLLVYLQIVYTCCSIKYTHRASFKIMRVKIKMEWKLIFSCCTPLGHFVFLLGYPIPLRRFLGWDGVVEGERCIRVVIPEAEGEGIESQKPLPSADSTVYLSLPAVPGLGRPGAGDSAHAWRK